MSIQITSANLTPEQVQAQLAEFDAAGKAESAPAEQAEQKQAAESEPAEAEAKEEKEESEEDADESEESKETKDDEAEKEKPEKKKESGFQRRVRKLNAAKAAAQQEAEYWKKVALEKGGEKPEPKADPKPEPGKDAEPNPDDYETPAAYYKALARYEITQERKAIEAKERQSALEKEHQSLRNSHFEREKSFAAKVDDYADVIGEVAELPVSPAFEHEILSSEHGPALMYELAKNPEEFERINKLGPLAVARELGKLEYKLTSQASEAKKPEPKKLTNAPKPIDPVGSKGGPVEKSIFDPNISQADFERLRNKQLAERWA